MNEDNDKINEIEKWKKEMDEMFKNTIKEELKSPAKPINLTRINKEELNCNIDQLEDFSKDKAFEELNKIRNAFIEFQDKIHELVMFDYISDPVNLFAELGSDLSRLIGNEVDLSSFNEEYKNKYEDLKVLRAEILTKIYNKYKKGRK